LKYSLKVPVVFHSFYALYVLGPKLLLIASTLSCKAGSEISVVVRIFTFVSSSGSKSCLLQDENPTKQFRKFFSLSAASICDIESCQRITPAFGEPAKQAAKFEILID
jgi:hypothetical protein